MKSLKFMAKYLFKYWPMLLIAFFFILVSTWLQIKAPQLMGESIENLTSLVTVHNANNAKEEIVAEMNATFQEGITVEDLNTQISEMTDAEFEAQLVENGVNVGQINMMAAAQGVTAKELFLDDSIPQIYNAKVNMAAKISEEMATQTITVDELNEEFLAMSESEFDTFMEEQDPSYDPEKMESQLGVSAYELFTQTEEYRNEIFVESVVMFGLALFLTMLASLIYMFIMAFVSGNTTNNMRTALFDKLQRLSIRFFDASDDGDILSRFTNDIDNMSNAINQSLVQVVSAIVLLIWIAVVMLQEDPSLALITMSLAPIAILCCVFTAVKASKYVSQQQNDLGTLNAYIDEKISGQRIVIAQGIEEEVKDGFKPHNDKYFNTSIRGQVYSGMMNPIIQGFSLVNLAIIIFAGAISVVEGDLSIAMYIAFIQYSQRFYQPLMQIAGQYAIIQLALSGGKRISEVFDEDEDIQHEDGSLEIKGITGHVEFKDVSFGYDANKPVLKNINISVEAGKMVALVGPTGSGKTTVMNLLNRFYDVNSGEIIYDGNNINDLCVDNLRSHVGIVLQDSVLFAGTIAENIKFGKPEATQEEVENAAKLANVHEFIMEQEKGYETVISNNSTLFSVGQKQLMSIARTIITDPDLLILDEATSNVDTVTEAKIQAAMENVIHSRTSFVIAHRLKTILNADKIIVLKDGEIIEEGSHEELLTEDGFYAELYKNQFVLN